MLPHADPRTETGPLDPRTAWITPLLVLGYKRELTETDLPKMDSSREASRLADEFEMHFKRRKEAVEAWNRSLDNGSFTPSALQRFRWQVWHRLTGFGSLDGRREVGIALALNDTFKVQFWLAGEVDSLSSAPRFADALVLRSIQGYR